MLMAYVLLVRKAAYAEISLDELIVIRTVRTAEASNVESNSARWFQWSSGKISSPFFAVNDDTDSPSIARSWPVYKREACCPECGSTLPVAFSHRDFGSLTLG